MDCQRVDQKPWQEKGRRQDTYRAASLRLVRRPYRQESDLSDL